MINRYMLLIVTLALFSVAFDTYASMNDFLQRNTWEIGPEFTHHDYTEYVSGSVLMEDTGSLIGLYLAYTHRSWIPESSDDSEENQLDGGLLFSIEGLLSTGEVDYDGQLTDGTPYTIDGIDATEREIRFLLGYDSVQSESSLQTIYAGIGFRQFNDDSSFDVYGYERLSEYLYVPIGFKFTSQKADNWIHCGTLEFDIFISGEQTSYLSDVGLADITNDQNDGYGFRLSYRFQRKFDEYNVSIEPFLRFWHIDDSDLVYSGGYYYFEPENETVQVGVRLIWSF